MSILSSIISTVGSATVGGLGGGVMRLIPEGIKYFEGRDERKHELDMSRLQLEIDAKRATQQIDIVHAQGEAQVQAGEMQAWVEAIKAQAQPTGIKWVDAANAFVRPLLTYWWMALFTLYKSTVLWGAWRAVDSFKDLGPMIWTTDDMVIFSGLLAFWFADRTMHKMRGK